MPNHIIYSIYEQHFDIERKSVPFVSAVENSSQLLRILFVDDELEILNALKRQISLVDDIEGYYTSKPLEVIDFLNEQPVDVVVADIVMPDIDGITLLSKIKEIYPDIIRILLTAHGDYQTSMRALNEAEVFGFITKPWEKNYLFGHFEMAKKTLNTKFTNAFKEQLPVFAIASWENDEEVNQLLYTATDKERTDEFCKRIFLTSVGLFGVKHRFDDNLFTLPLKGIDVVVRGYLTKIEVNDTINNVGIFAFFNEISPETRDSIDTLIRDTETKIRARGRLMGQDETSLSGIVGLLSTEINENFRSMLKLT